jgi:hypothetical protein
MKPKRNPQKQKCYGIVQKFRGYFMEDLECIHCLHYGGKKNSCLLDTCCCVEEKQDAKANGRIKQPRGFNSWDS